MDIVIIGGGNAAVAIIEELESISSHRISGIADLDENAPGMKKAADQGVKTYTDFHKMLSEMTYDLVFELTGVRKVFKQAVEATGAEDKVLPADSVKIIYDLIESFQSKRASGAEITDKISEEFKSLSSNLENASSLITNSSEQIQDFLEEARFISINAGIQSQKAGSYGKTFIPIVEKFTSLIEEIRKVLVNVDKASEQSQTVSENIKSAETKIQSIFQDSDGAENTQG